MQTDLFAKIRYPEGLVYKEEAISPGEEQRYMRYFAGLTLVPFAFHCFVGNRRTASFGIRYDYSEGGLHSAEAIPAALTPLIEIASAEALVPAAEIRHALVTKYRPGAGIGWHRDKGEFGTVIAFSFGARAKLRFRRKTENAWQRLSSDVEPRSVSILAGGARQVWQHSIPPQETLRYSVTFRTLAKNHP